MQAAPPNPYDRFEGAGGKATLFTLRKSDFTPKLGIPTVKPQIKSVQIPLTLGSTKIVLVHNGRAAITRPGRTTR